MRWAALFSDLESRLAARLDADVRAEALDIALAEMSQLGLADRLRAHATVELLTRGGVRASGAIEHVGADFVLLAGRGRQLLVPLGSVVTCRLGARAVQDTSVCARLRLGYALRQLAAAGERVRVGLPGGEGVSGLIVRVGADHLDIDEGGRQITVASAAIDAVTTV